VPYAATSGTVSRAFMTDDSTIGSMVLRRSDEMRVIANRRLLHLAARHGDCVDQAADWYRVARSSDWHALVDVRRSFRHADIVGDKTVFNIKGNDYRLIVHIRCSTGTIYIKDLLTHAEYDKGAWKD
jgi:mRNA interferase HigB